MKNLNIENFESGKDFVETNRTIEVTGVAALTSVSPGLGLNCIDAARATYMAAIRHEFEVPSGFILQANWASLELHGCFFVLFQARNDSSEARLIVCLNNIQIKSTKLLV